MYLFAWQTKFARIKGWLDRAGALALLEQVRDKGGGEGEIGKRP